MSTPEILFWVSAFLVGYAYVGYPLLAWLLSRLIGRPVARSEILPRVTVLIAAHNEADCIGETVHNKLRQDYPEDLLDMIVVSDGSTDGTDNIVNQLGERVRLIRQEPRAGKTAAINRAVRDARGDILVFADANSIYAPDAVRNLVANFADDSVGYVTGKMVYMSPGGSLVGDGCSAYMRYENWLRAHESRLASVVGVDGGVDATRRSLFEPMGEDQLPDFVLPMRIAAKGYRVVYEPGALLCEPALSNQADEYRMRVRVSLRALCAIWDLRALLNPLRYGLLALQLVSHKLLRYLAFIPLTTLLLSSIVLVDQSRLYLMATVLQLMIYLAAAFGWIRGRTDSSLVTASYYFVLLNITAAHATYRFVRGERQALWTPRTG